LPFEDAFWKTPPFLQSKAAALDWIKGLITALPANWTAGENNNVGFHVKLIVRNEPHKKQPEDVGRRENTVLTRNDPPENSNESEG